MTSHESLPELISSQKLEEMTDADVQKAVEAMDQDFLRFLDQECESEDAQRAGRARFQRKVYTEALDLIREVQETQGDPAKKEARVLAFLAEKQADLAEMDLADNTLKVALNELSEFIALYLQMAPVVEDAPSLKMRLLSSGLNIVPYLGGAKMAAEGVLGKTLAGEDLTGIGRMIHTAEGGLWLVLDTVTLGADEFLAGPGKSLLEAAGFVGDAANAAEKLKALSHGLIAVGPSEEMVKGARLLLKAPEAVEWLKETGNTLHLVKGVGAGAQMVYKAGEWLLSNDAVRTQADQTVKRGLETRLPFPEKSSEDPHTFLEEVARERAELLHSLGSAFDQKAA